MSTSSEHGSPRLPSGDQLAAIIFDLDGTLFLNAAMRRAMLWRMFLAGLARPVETLSEIRLITCYRRAQEELRGVESLTPDAQLRRTADRAGWAPERAAPVIARWMETRPLEVLPRCVRPGIEALLGAARSRPLKLAVLSDYPAAAKLRAMGLERYFSVVRSATDPDIGAFKPSPVGLRKILDELGTDVRHTVYVGDRPEIDGEAARRAGMAAVVFTERAGPPNGDWTAVRDVRALRRLLSV